MTYRPVVPRAYVGPGDVVSLAEDDHRYSWGPVRLRITVVRLEISRWYDGEWVWLQRIEIRPDGSDGELRSVLARVAALPHPTGAPALA
jgi:hypothetical protein